MERQEIQQRETQEEIFSHFVGKDVKCPYRDGRQLKVARGTLISCQAGFVRIEGHLGTIIINERNIEKMSLV